MRDTKGALTVPQSSFFNRLFNGNRIVMALSFARLGDAVGNSILIVVIPLYVAKLPSLWLPFPEPVRVGILISLYGLVAALFQPVFGAISDRIPYRKNLILVGLVIMGVATFSFIFTTRYADLIILRVVQGIGVAITIASSMALLATATQKATRGGSMGIYSTMRMVGFAMGPLLGGYLLDHYGFNLAFIAGTVFILLGLGSVLIWVNEPEEDHQVEKRGGFRLFDRNILTAGIIGAGLATFVMAIDFSMIAALENEFNQRLNQAAFGFGIAFSAMMFSRLLFQVPLGRLSDRWGRKPLIIAGLILMVPSTALLGYVDSTFQLTSVRAFQGLASAAIAAPAFALAADLSRVGSEGRQMSIVTMGFALGIAIGPLMAGIFAVHAFTTPFLIGAVLSVIAAWVVFQYVPETVTGDRRTSGLESSGSTSAEGD
ncbi:MAG: MFS transporter [Anaerolineales bacterium]